MHVVVADVDDAQDATGAERDRVVGAPVRDRGTQCRGVGGGAVGMLELAKTPRFAGLGI
jgi:hypothetical protein